MASDSVAAGGSGIRVTGARELRKALKAQGDAKDFSVLHRQIAALVLPVAQANAPVMTGALKSTIRASGTASSARIILGGKPKGVYFKARRLRDGSIREYPNRPILEVKYAWIRESRDRFVARSLEETRPQWEAMYWAEMERIAAKIGRAA